MSHRHPLAMDYIRSTEHRIRLSWSNILSDQFFERPILNSPYEIPAKHWELDDDGQPTQKVVVQRRSADFITPIPKPKKRKRAVANQQKMVFDEGEDLSSKNQQYEATSNINQIRAEVDRWRSDPNPNNWQVTPETARLLEYWRSDRNTAIRPFFCQVEAVETVIWLTEVASKAPGPGGKRALNYLDVANKDTGSELSRLALKLATGAGKTTIMAMLIAWQTVNAVRRPTSKNYTKGFLIVTPGITIRDRLQVLLPNDLNNYYDRLDLVPSDMRQDLLRAEIVITNYHAFQLRERMEISKGGRSLLQGRGPALSTLETEGQMMQRVMPNLMGMKNVMVMNDEAHHCYREKPSEEDDVALKGDDRKEAEKNNEAARVWITGLESVNKKIGIKRVIDLSATPFFLSGSGYAEGTLFPWTMSDFSLMDAIESGIVKLPRVPVSENIPGNDMPMFRNIWEHIRSDMPRKGRGKSGELDPLSIPLQLQTALTALYGHYKSVYDDWQDAGIPVPPSFIIVCNNTSTSKLVYDYVSGFDRHDEDGTTTPVAGRLELFRNSDENGNPFALPRTILIDSKQLESGDALDKNFRAMAAGPIEQFKKELISRTNDVQRAENITDQDLLREVMNTVGKEGTVGESIRCVVSVAMLTEGWDANTVTHILGIRAFGTQLLCEQVVGRALRRQSYELNDDGLFDVEYADILGIPFDFTARPVIAKAKRPKHTYQVKAMRPDFDHREIKFPRVSGYRIEMPEDRLAAVFNDDSKLILTPDLVGPSITSNAGIIGKSIDLTLESTKDIRRSTILYNLTHHLLMMPQWRDQNGDPKLSLFAQLKRITRHWLDEYLVCRGQTYPAQLLFQELANMACEKITAGITSSTNKSRPVKAMLDPYNPTGSTANVNFSTSKEGRWETKTGGKCHVNWVVLDSDWEAEFCRVAETHPKVVSYVKNHNLGFEVPYRYGSLNRTYIPDFIVQIDDGHDDLLNLVVEIKGYRADDAKVKKQTMDTYWVPGVNHLGTYGRWAFAEFTDVYETQAEFDQLIDSLTAQPAN